MANVADDSSTSIPIDNAVTSTQDDDEWETEESEDSDSSMEPEDEHGPEGFCKIVPGDLLKNYVAIKQIGWGNFSTCWLARHKDSTEEPCNEVAIKIIKCDEHYAEQARDEIQIHDKLLENPKFTPDVPIVRLLDNFVHKGRYGKHYCLVFEKLGKPVLKGIKKGGLPIPEAKKLAKDVLKALEFLHENRIIVTDIKPENILQTADETGYKLIDLGNACYTYKHFTEDVCTRQYRSPEVIVGIKYDTSVDIWGFACVFFEVLTGDYLFDPNKSSRYRKSEDHLRIMQELIGKYPKHLYKQGKYHREFFSKNGNLKIGNIGKTEDVATILVKLYGFEEASAQAVNQFLLPALNYNPTKRATATKLLADGFLNSVP